MRRLALLAMVSLASCGGPPRSLSYFRAHRDEAARVRVDCEVGARGGAACVNASQALVEGRGAARIAWHKNPF